MRRRKNAFWIALAAPGILWLAILFIVPFYAVLSIALGKLDQLIATADSLVRTLTVDDSAGPGCPWRDAGAAR